MNMLERGVFIMNLTIWVIIAICALIVIVMAGFEFGWWRAIRYDRWVTRAMKEYKLQTADKITEEGALMCAELLAQRQEQEHGPCMDLWPRPQDAVVEDLDYAAYVIADDL